MVSKGFKRDDGVFVKALDQALSSFNVERQAYYGGSFIGNHIHKALKVNGYSFHITSRLCVLVLLLPQQQ